MNSDLTQTDSLLPQNLEIWQQTLNWQPDETQMRQFQQLYELIVAGNRQLNLTRITEPSEFWEKHLWDSLRGVAPFLANLELLGGGDASQSNPQVIDIGTGAGFPGLPCAIAFPKWQVTLLDSTRKKMAFLDALLAQFGLENAKILIGRSEKINQQFHHRNHYNLALIRAVGSAPICAEYALPFLKVGGLAILYRGNWTDEEAADLQPVIEGLGGKLESIAAFTTPLSQSVRHCLYLRKVS